MKKMCLWVALGTLVAAFAWGTDYVVERVPEAAATRGSPGYDATRELKWDTGSPRWQTYLAGGVNAWIGNDFDISTLSTFRAIKTIRVYSGPGWPNDKWDGFRVGVYAFSGSVPGSLLWGPKYGIGTGSSYGWVDIGVNWTLPTGRDAFVGAMNQFYNYPGLDAFCIDNNPTFMGHSWQYSSGRWTLYKHSGALPYRNLMVRVVVDNETVAVAPTSLGRVKALYY